MHILMVVPGWPPDSFWDVLYYKFPPLSMAQLAGMTPRRHCLTYIDESLAPVDFSLKPDLVAITVMTPLAPRGYEIADRFKEKGIPVVIGGIHASNLPGEAGLHADAVAVGEADETWPDILRDAEKGTLKPVYRQSGYTRMENIPPADRSIYPRSGYFFENMIQTTRGCPYHCEFCTVTSFFGGSYRVRPIDTIVEEIRQLRRTPGYIFFADDNLIARPDHAQALMARLEEQPLRWVCQAPVTIGRDEGMLRRFQRAGCHGIFIGFESLNQENLGAMGKVQNNASLYEECISRIHDHGIGVYGSFVFGYDHDTVAVFDEFLAFAERNTLDGAFLPVLTPFPGTRVYERLKREGRILTEDWRLYDMATVAFRPARMSPEELQRGFWKVNRGFYSLGSTLRRLFTPRSILRRSNLIFTPMNLGHIPAVRKAHRRFGRS